MAAKRISNTAPMVDVDPVDTGAHRPEVVMTSAAGVAAAIDSGGNVSAVLAAGTASIGGATDAGSSIAAAWGVVGVPFTSADQHSAVASVTDAPTTGQKLVITDLHVSVDTAMSVTFKEETSATVVFGPYYLPANGSLVLVPRGKRKLATLNKKLQVITSAAGNISVMAAYYSEA